jgi:hypothetical protein
MISHRLRCIFIHIRKSGGTSIKKLLCGATGENENNVLNNGALDPHCDNIIHAYPDYFRFAVVRNPYARFVSAWKYLYSTRDTSLDEVLTNLPTPHLIECLLNPRIGHVYRSAVFMEILKHWTQKSSLGNFRHLLGHDWRHISALQSDLLYNKRGDEVFHRVYKLEHLQESPDILLKDLGLAEHLKLPILNRKGSGEEYRKYFTHDSRRVFEKAFERDLEVLSYQF